MLYDGYYRVHASDHSLDFLFRFAVATSLPGCPTAAFRTAGERHSQHVALLPHGCSPVSCSTVVMAVNGSFAISVYVTRPVLYGEELTFDYSSVTESKVPMFVSPLGLNQSDDRLLLSG